MQKLTLAVIHHHPAEGAGRITDWANIYGHQLVHFMAPNNELPNLMNVDGLIILGGPMDVVENPAWMQAEQTLIKQAVNENMPIIGICLGAQLLASTLGAKLHALPEPELGWLPIKLVDNQVMQVPQWHYQGFKFCDSKVSITANSTAWPQQMFVHQRQVGIQFHPEWNAEQIQQLQHAFGDTCPFDTDEALVFDAQNQLEQWFFKLMSQMFK
ncbi:type 1 glutamine amidotransferase [Shewanella sp. TC10]|uniref:type 1 glutamine amidotransferase n=1 Tax=Shewanella sp. TC10 TaxID=1419739 RepID=UPI00129E3D6D|nr:type 1 glutamine amidotransferase [Shewanella sp. TC10]